MAGVKSGSLVTAAAVAVALTASACGSGGETGQSGRPAAKPPPTAPAAATGARPPVVMIVFDEFSTASLLDAEGRIDPVRYPNFARLAQDANWFPYATAAVDETSRAMGTLLTGVEAKEAGQATYEKYPRSLFTLLGGRGYRMHVDQEVTDLCPRRLCPSSHAQNQKSVLRQLAQGRPARFERWARAIRPSARPTLHFKHLLLPHLPLRYLPSGHSYTDQTKGLDDGMMHAFSSRWPVTQAYQRHLLQVGFLDRELGKVITRLRATGLYDRAMIVLSADNGESFGRYGNRHEISKANAADIALTPLIIKTPFQRAGRVVARHVRTLDVVPTIAAVAGVKPRRRLAGVPLLGPRARGVPSGATLVQRSGRRIHLSYRTLRRRSRAALQIKLRLFGSGKGPPGLFGIGPHRELHGKSLSALAVGRAPRLAARVDGRGAWRSVRLGSSSVPAQVTGRLAGKRAGGAHDLAFAVNGVVVATAPSFTLPGRRGRFFSAMVPEIAFRGGANTLDLLEISRAPGGLRLARLPG